MSERDPTLKQCRHHYAKIARLRKKMADALHDAYCMNVIVYKSSTDETDPRYKGHYVCDTLEDLWQKFKRSSQAPMAEALRKDIMSEVMK